ncbi:MAG: fatty acid desaturase [Proteobacteria bacterium]|nr:fatty acid desaturase [Pseudomonadota bacterium]MBU1233642.1 fatty acid desaturase [Pseudomonadota bacterium]MBU1420349.1 fatty acid desaturase [Pseudomonadota bacterium]MBU1454359.1 fatty acid desaturase [Pseudomonadota bacterium]
MAIHESERIKSVEEKSKTGQIWPDWHQQLKYFRPSNRLEAAWQLLNTMVPYFCLWYLMVRSIQLGYSYIWTLILALPAAAFLVRLFILFHDCVHGSFFKSKSANTFFGYFLGVLVFTSFEDWRFTHLRHHGTYANLDSRGFGDIWTMTLKEYENSSTMKQLRYRIYRNPIVLVGLGAIFNFLFYNRIPDLRVKRKERMGVTLTNLLILAVALSAARIIGWRAYLLIQLPVLWLAGGAGIWLFYVQHQFEGGYWARKNEWDPLRAAMEGSSFYNLPAVLRWLSGNIGYHHIHHLNPMIPNYHLKKCYDSVPELRAKAPLTIRKSIHCHRLKLWDEKLQKMVVFP